MPFWKTTILSRQIQDGSSLAAIKLFTGHSGDCTRIVYQGSDGGFKWLNSAITTGDNPMFTAKKGSPLTMVGWTCINVSAVRAYTLSESNTICEHCSEGGQWYEGALTAKKIKTAPNSKLSAIRWPSGRRVYYQSTDNYIYEIANNNDGNWKETKLPVPGALHGTGLAVQCWGNNSIRIYYQDTEGFIREFWKEYNTGWLQGGLKYPAKIGTPISIVGWPGHQRLYFFGSDNIVQEQCKEDGGEWYEGILSEALGEIEAFAMPDSGLAVSEYDGNVIIYFRSPMDTLGVRQYGTKSGGTWWVQSKGIGINDAAETEYPGIPPMIKSPPRTPEMLDKVSKDLAEHLK